ncbi:MAG: cell division protein CrgA [Motilibacteraceae bacterium]
MPKSRLRRRSTFTPPPAKSPVKVGGSRWVAPAMLACFVVGLVWIVVYYVSQAGYPIPGIGNANMLIGFAFIIVGFVLSTRWK